MRKRDFLAQGAKHPGHHRPRFARHAFLAGLIVAAAALPACAPEEGGRQRLCARALPALEPDGRVQVLGPDAPEPATPDAITLRYRVQGVEGERRITCRFAPRPSDRGGLDLVGVRLEGRGELSPVALFLLREYWLNRPESAQSQEDRPAGLAASAYLLQQLVNASAPAAVYALLATGYALIYGIIGRINLAFGEFTTVGAFAALSGMMLAAYPTAAGLPTAVLLGLAFALATGAALGAVVCEGVFAPLRRSDSQAPLIATIGLAIALGESLRLLAGSRGHWLPPLFGEPLVLSRGPGGEVTVGRGQLVVAALSLVLIGGVLLLMRRSRFGRAYRACADDLGMAALVGVPVGRIITLASMLGGALAAAAGFVLAVHYGLVGFAMGTVWGLKALTAAVLGGIGSVPGAALGGLLLGLLESLWAAYLPGGYREVAVFALLALVLALRPQGLFGQPAAADNPMLWRGRSPSSW
jgi:branched-chain amino acid transport system permease protein